MLTTHKTYYENELKRMNGKVVASDHRVVDNPGDEYRIDTTMMMEIDSDTVSSESVDEDIAMSNIEYAKKLKKIKK